jgi:hypothetical protein
MLRKNLTLLTLLAVGLMAPVAIADWLPDDGFRMHFP